MTQPATIHDALLTTTADGDVRLLGGRCRACGRPCFPRASTCPYCGADDVEPVTLPDTGTLWGWTAVTSAPPGYEGPVPFGFGVVELTNGLRVITRLTESDPAQLTFGMPMRLVADALRVDGAHVVTYAFAPAGTAAA